MPDRYSYPNSLVLINKLGITDYDPWKAVETAAIHQRMVELTEHLQPARPRRRMGHRLVANSRGRVRPRPYDVDELLARVREIAEAGA